MEVRGDHHIIGENFDVSLEPNELIPVQGKERISSSYINQCKEKYEISEGSPMNAVVVGVNKGNIGEAIAEEMCFSGWFVEGYNSDNWDRNFSEGASALILANASNHLDWVENFPDFRAERIISDTLLESILSAQEFVKRAIKHPYRKKIIFIGSMAYKNVLNASSVYCAAKAGLAHYSRCLAWELAPKGFDVFCVNASNVEATPMAEATIEGIMRYRGVSREEAEAYWSAILPRERFLTKREIAYTVLQLLDQRNSYLSGSQIDLAGGQR